MHGQAKNGAGDIQSPSRQSDKLQVSAITNVSTDEKRNDVRDNGISMDTTQESAQTPQESKTKLPFSHAEERSKPPVKKRVSEEISEDTNERQENANKRRRTLEISRTTTPDTVRDQDLYAQQLLLKGNGYPLWDPQPKRHFGDPSAPAGVAIGDVGIITADGGFDFLFNVCVPADHPINPRDLPSAFSPLSPQLSHTDICEFQEYAPGEYLASASVERVPSNNGLAFECSGSEGAILILPDGAYHRDLVHSAFARFRDYGLRNAQAWYRYISKTYGNIENGDLHLVTGFDRAPSCGLAVYKNSGTQKSLLSFQGSLGSEHWEPSADGNYAKSKFVEKAREKSVAGIRSGRSESLCLFVRTFTITVGESVWEDICSGISEKPFSGLDATIPLGSACNFKVSGLPHSLRNIPSKNINEQLLRKMSTALVAITHDRDWYTVLQKGHENFSNIATLSQQIYDSNKICEEKNAVFFEWKKESTPIKRESSPALVVDTEITVEKSRHLSEMSLSKNNSVSEHALVLHKLAYSLLAASRGLKDQRPTDSVKFMDEAIKNLVEVLRLRSRIDPERPASLHLFATTIWTRYQLWGRRDDVDLAIRYYSDALALRSQECGYLSDLATALWTRYNLSRHSKDLEESIAHYRTAVSRRAKNHPGLPLLLGNLATALWTRYTQFKQPADMESAIAYLRNASLSYPHPCDSRALSNLGNILLARFDRDNHDGDLEEAIAVYRSALEKTSASSHTRSEFHSNLADSIYRRYELTGQSKDLHEAIKLYSELLALPPPRHRDRITSLIILAESLEARYKRFRKPEDQEKAYGYYRSALEICSSREPRRLNLLEILSAADLAHFRETGRVAALDAAVRYSREALSLQTPDGSARYKSLMTTLVVCLKARYEKLRRGEDKEEAKVYEREMRRSLRPSYTSARDPGRPQMLVTSGVPTGGATGFTGGETAHAGHGTYPRGIHWQKPALST